MWTSRPLDPEAAQGHDAFDSIKPKHFLCSRLLKFASVLAAVYCFSLCELAADVLVPDTMVGDKVTNGEGSSYQLLSAVTARGRERGSCDRAMDCKDQWYDGKWVHRPNRTRNEFAYFENDMLGCGEVDFRKMYPERTKHQVHNQYDYDTGPGCCVMHQFDKERMCDVLEGLGVTSILIVGDSINSMLATSLYLMMGGKARFHWRMGPVQVPICQTRDKPVKLAFIRNDLLYTEAEPMDHWRDPPAGVEVKHDTWHVNHPWVPALQDYAVDLLILNAGAHVHHAALHEQIVDRVAAALKEHYNGRLFWRTTYPGHPNCEKYFNKGPEQDASIKWAFTQKENEDYSWSLFDSYNEYAVPRMRKIGADIMASEKMTYLRADGHANPIKNIDCLHYWLPGVPDWWNVALYNQLEAEYLAKLKAENKHAPWRPVVIDDNLE